MSSDVAIQVAQLDKLTSFKSVSGSLSWNVMKTINAAVNDVHSITTTTTQCLRAYCIYEYHLNPNQIISVDPELVRIINGLVAPSTNGTRNMCRNQERYARVENFFNKHFKDLIVRNKDEVNENEEEEDQNDEREIIERTNKLIDEWTAHLVRPKPASKKAKKYTKRKKVAKKKRKINGKSSRSRFRRYRINRQRKEHMDRGPKPHLEEIYGAGAGASDTTDVSISKYSNVLKYSTTEIVTAYKNNVFNHYDKYLKSVVKATFEFDKDNNREPHKIVEDLISGVYYGNVMDPVQQDWIIDNSEMISSMSKEDAIDYIWDYWEFVDSREYFVRLLRDIQLVRDTLMGIQDYVNLNGGMKCRLLMGKNIDQFDEGLVDQVTDVLESIEFEWTNSDWKNVSLCFQDRFDYRFWLASCCYSAVKEFRAAFVSNFGVEEGSNLIRIAEIDRKAMRKCFKNNDEFKSMLKSERITALKNQDLEIFQKNELEDYLKLPLRMDVDKIKEESTLYGGKLTYKEWICRCAAMTDVKIIENFEKSYGLQNHYAHAEALYKCAIEFHDHDPLAVQLKSNERYHEWIYSARELLLPRYIYKDLETGLEKNPFKFQRYMIYMNLYLENQDRKLYQPLPMRTEMTPKYIYLTTTELIDICDGVDGINLINRLQEIDPRIVGKKYLKSNITTHQDQIWRLLMPGLFEQERLLGPQTLGDCKVGKRNLKFANAIRTDGVTAHVVMKTYQVDKGEKSVSVPKTKCKKDTPYGDKISDKLIDDIKNGKYTVVGLDPGKKDLATVSGINVEVPHPDDNKTEYYLKDHLKQVRYSYVQRRREGRMSRNMKRMKHMETDALKAAEKKLCDFSGKTCNLDGFLEYVREKQLFTKEFIRHYQDVRYRKMRYDRHIHTKRSQDNFIERLIQTFASEEYLELRRKCIQDKRRPPKPDIIIAYGDWNQCNSLRGLYPSMGIGLRRLIERHFHVFMINEMNTSRTCYRCHGEMENMCHKRIWKELNGEKSESVEKLHSLLRCKSCGRVCNRDTNGSLNIRMLMMKCVYRERRPEPFRTRKKKLEDRCPEEKSQWKLTYQ